MNLHIDLFKDNNICERVGKITAPLVRRDFVLSQDISNYKDFKTDDPAMQFHINEVLSKANKNRTYKHPIFPIKIDSHVELEKAGLGKDDRPYRVIITMEDSLDYVLHLAIGADWRNICKMPNYRLISKGILNLDFDSIGEFSFANLLGLDEKLDEYLANLEKYEETLKRVIFCFFSECLTKAQDIVSYIAVYLKYFYEEQNIRLVIKSMSADTIVIASNVPINIKLELPDDYSIFVKSFEVNKYLYSNNLEYRGGSE